jgi:hypothetical protein
MIRICMMLTETVTVAPSNSTKPPRTTGSSGFTRAPWLTCTRFCRKMLMPIAEISGARRKEPRSGR